MTNKLTLNAVFLDRDGASPVIVSGRDAWALQELVKAGRRGITPIDQPAPRWSAYVYKLRHSGIDIETLHERHRGPFPGTHARYVLRSNVHLEVVHHGTQE